MELTAKQQELINNRINGNLTLFKEGVRKLSKKDLIDFIYNVGDGEQSVYSFQEILSLCHNCF